MYRVWNAVNRPKDVLIRDWHRHFISVPSPAAGYHVIEAVRSFQTSDCSAERSEFGLEYLCVDGWKEWFDDAGLDVVEHYESLARRTVLVP
jgi:hypothetical protein